MKSKWDAVSNRLQSYKTALNSVLKEEDFESVKSKASSYNRRVK